jgi:hypothetical protein
MEHRIVKDRPGVDYTEDQWAQVCVAVARVRRDPLGDIERDALRFAADDYLFGLSQKESTRLPLLTTERKAWKAASRSIENLQRALDAGTRAQRLGRNDEYRWCIVAKESPPEIIHVMTSTEVNILLARLKFQIDALSSGCRYRHWWWWSYTGRLEPRIPYMQQILWLWTHHFGGKLTLSVDSTRLRARVYGPLVDYIAAVAGPIMKGAVPKPSALRDIVERQKSFYTWLTKYERLSKTKIEPWAYNRAVLMRERDPHGDVASRS